VATIKAPVLGLARVALSDVGSNVRELVRIAWPWYAGVLLLQLASTLMAARDVGTSFLIEDEAGHGGAAAVLAGCLGGLAVAARSVAWSRKVILGEALTHPAPLNGRVVRYLLCSLLLFVTLFAPLLVTAILGAGYALQGGTAQAAFSSTLGPAAGGLAVTAMLALGALVCVRLSILSAAIAVGDKSFGPRASWVATRGNGGRLLLAFLFFGATYLPLLLVLDHFALPQAPFADSPVRAAGATLAAAVRAGYEIAGGVVGASLVARIYLHLTRPTAAYSHPA
jgi:hypothetical protein